MNPFVIFHINYILKRIPFLGLEDAHCLCNAIHVEATVYSDRPSNHFWCICRHHWILFLQYTNDTIYKRWYFLVNIIFHINKQNIFVTLMKWALNGGGEVLMWVSPLRHAVWLDFFDFGQLLKPLATINFPKLPTFFGNFCKGVKVFNFSSEIIFGQLS